MIPTPYPLEDPLRPIGPVKGVVIRMCACCENVPVWDNDIYCPPCAKNHKKQILVKPVKPYEPRPYGEPIPPKTTGMFKRLFHNRGADKDE